MSKPLFIWYWNLQKLEVKDCSFEGDVAIAANSKQNSQDNLSA